MLKTESVNYINSLAKMLSSFASATGSSVIAAEAYGKKNYLTEFVSRYEIPAEKLALVPSEEKLSELLKRWFCGEGKSSGKDRLLARCFVWQLRRGFGEPKSVYVLGDDRSVLQDLSSVEDGAPHYAVEDLMFAVYPEGTLCFLLGHSE